jgi:predicted nucleic acid-binding protein
MYRQLKSSATGVPNAAKYVIPSARSAITQTLMTIDIFDVEIVGLTRDIVLAQCQDIALQMKGVRAADALHVTTARLHDSDILVSSDSGILDLDGQLKTASGKTLRCIDTDAAIALL